MKANEKKNSQQTILQLIGLPCLTFIIGFVSVWVISLFFLSNESLDKDSANGIQNEEVIPVPPKDTFDEKKLQNYKQQLESENLLYVYVDNMYQWLQDSINAAHVDSLFLQEVNGYHEIVQLLREGEIEAVIDYQNEHQVLSDTHLWQIRAIYKGWRDEQGEHEYDKIGVAEAREQFKKEYVNIVSFNELDKIHEGKSEKATSTTPDIQ